MGEDPGYMSDQASLVRRLARVEGQIRGVLEMVETERYCIDILAQITAVQKALDRVALLVVSDHARHCVVAAPEASREQRTEELIQALDRLVSRA
ncbi:MAG: metal-sensitive transcriptional regulator [Solirubrobacterales bacterium]